MRALITGLLLLVSLGFAQDPELVKKAEQRGCRSSIHISGYI